MAPVTLAERGPWREVVVVALAVVFGSPSLWLSGAMGFLARGGLLLLALPIWSLPSPIGITTLLGADIIDGTGLSARGWTLAAAALLGLIGLLLTALTVAATADLLALERYLTDEETVEVRQRRVGRLPWRGGRLRLVLSAVGIQLVALIPAAWAAAAAVSAAVEVGRREVLLPTSTSLPFVQLVVEGARVQLILLGLAIAFAEIVATLVTRRLLLGRGGFDHLGGALNLVRRPLVPLVTFALGWIVTVIVLIPATWAVVTAWSGLRTAYLAPIPADRADLLLPLGAATVMFVAVWLSAVVLMGFASAVRGALWTGAALRDRPRPRSGEGPLLHSAAPVPPERAKD
jgi:hypothetical protein